MTYRIPPGTPKALKAEASEGGQRMTVENQPESVDSRASSVDGADSRDVREDQWSGSVRAWIAGQTNVEPFVERGSDTGEVPPNPIAGAAIVTLPARRVGVRIARAPDHDTYSRPSALSEYLLFRGYGLDEGDL